MPDPIARSGLKVPWKSEPPVATSPHRFAIFTKPSRSSSSSGRTSLEAREPRLGKLGDRGLEAGRFEPERERVGQHRQRADPRAASIVVSASIKAFGM